MAKVGIITDTIACLSEDKIKEFGIGIVPIAMNINGKPYRDQVDLTPDAFWKMFDDVKEFTTGAPPITQYTDVFSQISQSTNEIVCTFVSKNLSAINETALQARDVFKQEHPGVNIESIDSQSAAGAQGFIVTEMAKAAAAGKTMAEVLEIGQDMIKRAKFVCAMDTLKYLIKSGRAPKTAYMGELFQVKPIIGMTNNSGVVENIARARGKAASQEKLVDLIKDYADVSKPLHVNVHHTNNIEDGNRLRDIVTARYNCVEVLSSPYTPVMCGHTGPVCAISFYSEK